MTNELTKVLMTHFGSLEIDVVQADGQPEPGITRKQLGEMLEYADPQKAIENIHARNKERLDQFSVTLKMRATDGKSYDTVVYGFKGVLEICRYSNQPNADAVMDWAWDTLDRLRTGKIVVSPSQRLEALSIRLQLAEQKLQLFEEYNEDILYDFDQVVAAMRIYRKPPFGASHLKRWLAEKRIICSAHYKNDKPNQRYIELDWFRLVMHEWKRWGVRRYEPRYLITQRGFNGMIDLAIREHVINLPLPKDYCLPNMAVEFGNAGLSPEVGGALEVPDPYGTGTLRVV
jgi:hypothetical protein